MKYFLWRGDPHMGLHVEAKPEGAELGSYCFLFPRAGSRGCTHRQSLAPSLLQKVMVRSDKAGNVNKKHVCFNVTAVCLSIVLVLWFSGRSPGLRCCSHGVVAARCELCVVPVLRVTSAQVPLPMEQLTCHQGLCSQATICCQFVTSRGGNNSLRWQRVTEQRWRQNKLPGERLERWLASQESVWKHPILWSSCSTWCREPIQFKCWNISVSVKKFSSNLQISWNYSIIQIVCN